MTPSQLKAHVEARGEQPHFFTRATMKFFGDTMSNYGVRKTVVLAHYDGSGKYHANGVHREAWELYRKRPVKGGNQSSAYFDAKTFTRIHAKRSVAA